MKKSFFVLGLILIGILFSGCTSPINDVESVAKTNALAQEFLQQYPNAEVRVTLLSAGAVAGDADFTQNCEGVEAKQYYKVAFSDDATNLSVLTWVDPDSKQVVCAFKKGTSQPPTDEIFSGTVTYEGDGVYTFVKEGESLKTTNQQYILQVSEINDNQVLIDVYSRDRSNNYVFLAQLIALNGVISTIQLADVAVITTDFDSASKTITSLALSGTKEFTKTPTHTGDGIYLNWEQGQSIKSTSGAYVFELFDFKTTESGTNWAIIKVYSKAVDNKYRFSTFILAGEGVVSSSSGFLSAIASGINPTAKKITSIEITENGEFTGGTTFQGNDPHLNAEKGNSIKSDSGSYIFKISDYKTTEQGTNFALITIYFKSVNKYVFGGFILAGESTPSSRQSLTVTATGIDPANDNIDSIEVSESGTPTCTETWQCTAWQPQECPDSGQQTRTCTDTSNCGTTQNKPSETQSCEPSGTDDTFEGQPDFEGDSIYLYVDVGTSIRTTNREYILELDEITTSSCASFKVYKKQSNGDYLNVGTTVPCKGLLGLLEGENFVVQISDVSQSSQQAIGLSLSGNYVLEDTSVDYPDSYGMLINLKKGDKAELKDGVYTYIVELFDFYDDSGALLKIYRKSLITGEYQFKAFAPLSGQGGNVSVTSAEVDMTFIWSEVNVSNETVASLQFAKTHPSPDPESNPGTMVEGANFFVGEGSRFTNDNYVVDFTEIRDGAAIFKVYTKSPFDGDYRFSGLILALNGVISTNALTPIAIWANEINYEPNKIASVGIATEYTYNGIPEFSGDGPHSNVAKGEAIELSNGLILKVATVDDGRAHLLIYRESFGEKRFGGLILALDGAVSSSTLIPSVSVLTSDTDGTTETIGSIEITVTS